MSEEKPIHVPRPKYPELMYTTGDVPALGTDRTEDTTHLLDYWRVILSRRWTILAVFLTIVTVTFVYTFKQTPIYEAQVSIQIDRENSNVLTFQDIYEVETTTDDTLRTQFEVLKSRSLARRVIETLHLDQNEEFQQQKPSIVQTYVADVRRLFLPVAPSKDTSDPLQPIIDEYLRRLHVSPVPRARLATDSFC